MNKYLGCFFGIIGVLIIGSIVGTLDEALYSFFSIGLDEIKKIVQDLLELYHGDKVDLLEQQPWTKDYLASESK